MVYDDDGIHTPFERPPFPPSPPEPIPGVTVTEIRAHTTDLESGPSGDEPDPRPGLDAELGQ